MMILDSGLLFWVTLYIGLLTVYTSTNNLHIVYLLCKTV